MRYSESGATHRGAEMRAILVAILLSVSSIPTLSVEANPNSLDAVKAQALGRWRYASGPVSDQKFQRDKTKCLTMIDAVPPDPMSSPTVFQIKLYSFFINCMKAEGYTN